MVQIPRGVSSSFRFWVKNTHKNDSVFLPGRRMIECVSSVKASVTSFQGIGVELRTQRRDPFEWISGAKGSHSSVRQCATEPCQLEVGMLPPCETAHGAQHGASKMPRASTSGPPKSWQSRNGYSDFE